MVVKLGLRRRALFRDWPHHALALHTVISGFDIRYPLIGEISEALLLPELRQRAGKRALILWQWRPRLAKPDSSRSRSQFFVNVINDVRNITMARKKDVLVYCGNNAVVTSGEMLQRPLVADSSAVREHWLLRCRYWSSVSVWRTSPGTGLARY